MKRLRFLVLLLLCLPLGADDVVHLKDGRQVTGKVLEYEKHVEVETSDGKIQRIEKDKVQKIVYESRVIHCPEVVDLPNAEVQKGEWDFLGYKGLLIAVAREDGRILGLEVGTGRKQWEIKAEGRDGAPVMAGRFLYFMRFDKIVDDKQKYKYQGASYSKEVHRLTLTCHDLATGKEEWNLIFDNNDRSDLLWEFVRGSAAIYLSGKFVVVRATKQGWPMDKSSVVDKSTSRTFVTLYVVDSEQKKRISSYDNEDILRASEVFVSEESILYQIHPSVDSFPILSVGLKDGKLRWKVDDIRGQILAVEGDLIFTRDDTHLWAYSARNGKKVDKWSLEYSGAQIAGVDGNYIYIFRKNRSPKAIFAYELKKAQEAFRIEIPDKEDFTFRGLKGKLLLYTNRANTIFAFDTLARREAWKFTTGENGVPSDFCRVGTGLYFYKDMHVWLVDMATGQKVWGVIGEWQRILPVGEAGLICAQRAGVQILRERTVPAKAVFLSPSGTPLRFLHAENCFSRPAVTGDLLYTFGSRGSIYRFSLKEKSLLHTAKVTDNPMEDPPPPFAHGNRWGVTAQSSLRVYDSVKNEGVWQAPHYLADRATPYLLTESHVLVTTSSGVTKLDLVTGKKIWDTEVIGSVVGLTLTAEALWVVDPTRLFQINPADGKTIKSFDIQQGASAVSIDGEYVLVASYGYWIARFNIAEKNWKWQHRAVNQDVKISPSFRGTTLSGGGMTYFSSADGKVLAFDSKTGEQKWSHDTREFTSPMILLGDKLHFASRDAGLVTLNARTGATVSLTLMPDTVKWSPVVLDGKAYFWSTDGWMVEAD